MKAITTWANKNKCKFGTKWNVCCYSPRNSDTHEDAKWEVFKYARKKGWTVGTEVEFDKTRGRADIYLPDFDKVVEVAYTEKEKSLLEKEFKYPVDEVIKIRVHRSRNDTIFLISEALEAIE